MAKSPISLDIQIDGAAWRRIPRLRAKLLKAAETTIAHLPAKFRFPASATLLLTGNARLRQLNHDFRGIDKTTNVLSFPQYSPTDLAKQGRKQPSVELGDIAISHAYAQKEAKETKKLIANHVTHLAIHGLLHLFGYDHLDDDEAQTMERAEAKIMNELGLPDPYQAATPPPVARKSKAPKTKQKRNAK